MSVGPLNSIASAAGSHLAQVRGSDADRSQSERSQQVAQSKLDQSQQGDASLEEGHEAGDRDADGRDYGAAGEGAPRDEAEANSPADAETGSEPESPADPTGARGSRLDISG